MVLRSLAAFFLQSNFSAKGEVRLLGAKIGGIFSCIDGTFSNERGNALSADRIKVDGNVFLQDKFDATGEVRLLGAKIGGHLSCIDGTFSNERGDALDASNAQITGAIFWRGGTSAVGRVQLSGASCTELNDDWAIGQRHLALCHSTISPMGRSKAMAQWMRKRG